MKPSQIMSCPERFTSRNFSKHRRHKTANSWLFDSTLFETRPSNPNRRALNRNRVDVHSCFSLDLVLAIQKSKQLPFPIPSMGGSCSTVSAETRMANQLRENKRHSAPERPPHATEPPKLTAYSIPEEKTWEGDVNGGGSIPPGRSRLLKSPRKKRVVGPERKPRRGASVSSDGTTMLKDANSRTACLVAESKADIVAFRARMVSVPNTIMLLDQHETRNHVAAHQADGKYDQQQALNAANQKAARKFERACASAAPGNPALVAAARRRLAS